MFVWLSQLRWEEMLVFLPYLYLGEWNLKIIRKPKHITQ